MNIYRHIFLVGFSLVWYLGLVKISVGQTEVSGSITTNTEWTEAGSPYLIVDFLTVEQGARLTIKSGVEVRFADSPSPDNGALVLTVLGGLSIEGTAANPVILTGEYVSDPEHGQILISTGESIDIAHAIVNSLGKSHNALWGALVVGGTGSVSISETKITNCQSTCIYLFGTTGGAQIQISNSELISDSRAINVESMTGDEIVFESTYVEAVDVGVWVAAGSSQDMVLRNSMLLAPVGISNLSSSQIDAIQNWWGHGTGPFHKSLNPNGLGSSVSDGVIFSPWLVMTPGTVKPDLTTENMIVNTTDVNAGEAVTLNFDVVNQGGAPAPATTTNIRLSSSSSNVTPDDVLLRTIATPALEVNERYLHVEAVTIPADLGTRWKILHLGYPRCKQYCQSG